MKKQYIVDILTGAQLDKTVKVFGWVKAIRKHKSVVFIDIVDSTSVSGIQAVVGQNSVSTKVYTLATTLTRESAVCVEGILRHNPNNFKQLEVIAHDITVFNLAKEFSPSPREDFDIFDPSVADHVLTNRDLYLRHPKIMALMKYRSMVLWAARSWFEEHQFLEITAPILTQLPLYDDGTVIDLEVHNQKLYLTQCVGFYLEAATAAFERVYNIGPSFRKEESRSLRHLMEYWHIKAEIAFLNLEEGMKLVESFIAYLTQYCLDHQDAVTAAIDPPLEDALCGPFPRITYREALGILSKQGLSLPFGKSLGHDEEVALSKHANGPIWIVGVPRSVEPFPYVIDPDDPTLTRTADLIASRGNGELLGVAEKIYDLDSLQERMIEKGKWGKAEYDWVVRQREMGAVPRVGFGIGAERYIRWMLGVRHVRDAIPFPRTFGRSVYP